MCVGESDGREIILKGYDEAEEEIEVFKKAHSGCGSGIASMDCILGTGLQCYIHNYRRLEMGFYGPKFGRYS